MEIKRDEIIKVTKPRLNYYSKDTSKIGKSGLLQVGTEIEVNDFKEYKNVLFDFKFRILNITEEEKKMIKEAENGSIEEQYIQARFDVTYQVILDTEKNIDEITKHFMINMLEAYIKKDILDFYGEVGLPRIKLPQEIWDEEV